jgi:hypothetical protein
MRNRNLMIAESLTVEDRTRGMGGLVQLSLCANSVPTQTNGAIL